MKIPSSTQTIWCGLLTLLTLSLLHAARAGSAPLTLDGVGKIAFDHYQNEDTEIYTMNADGTNQINLTNNPQPDSQSTWSPDGTQIAFSAFRYPGAKIYVMDASGANQRPLTSNPNGDYDPVWSPDGSRIAFTGFRNLGYQIYVMFANGSNQVNLTDNVLVQNRQPTWSPDSTRIAFVSSRDGNNEIYVMVASGANQTRLTNNPSNDQKPAWSPDGSKIAFYSMRDGNNEIYVMNADGSNPINVSNNPAGDFDPAWSPDGSKIAFASNRDSNTEIYVMDANGANQTRLTNNTTSDSRPSWQSIPGLPTPTPVPIPTRALNISTRMRVETGNNVLIGGFIVTGSMPKDVAVRGIGPSLKQSGISDVLADPTLNLRDSAGASVAQNDNWQDDPSQEKQLTAMGLDLQHPNESGMVTSLQPAAYTAILAGKSGGTGVGLVEIYDVNQVANSQLANISTRGFVLTGNNVMIGGFILGGGNSTHVALRGIGPSLAQAGLSPVLADPTLELHDGNGTTLISNDNWQDDAVSASQLTAIGLAPQDPLESGIYTSLPPGAFTAILAGKNGGTGIGLVEVYNVH